MKAVAAAFCGALLLASGAVFFVVFIGSAGSSKAAVEVEIPTGLSAAQTGSLLEQKGIIASALLFQAAAKATGFDRKLKPGKYLLRPGTPIFRALATLKAGANNDVKVSIPEGFSARQIADRLQAGGLCKADDFMGYVQSRRLEGYLFPATYQFDPAWPVDKIAHRMVQEFKRQIEAEYERTTPKPRLTLHQTVTLASIVEREAVLSSEKPLIAAIYLNRLRLRMRLEADPTVQYALGHWKKGLTLVDLKVVSPYNTYARYGLPPGPICSPGLDSVRGVLSPAKTDAIYFVADTKGGHTFSNTIEDHLKAKGQFKKNLRAIKERLRREAR